MSDTNVLTSQEDEAELKAKVMAERVDLEGKPVVPKVEEPVVEPPVVEEELSEEDKAKAEADAAAKKAEEENKDWAKEWIKTGNADADAAIDIMQAAGVSPVEGNAIFEKAIKSSNLDDVDWKLLEAKVGPATARLVRNGVEKFHAEEGSVIAETVAYGHEAVGGEANWNKLSKWSQAREASDPKWASEVASYRKAIDVGGAAAKLAINALKAAYEADSKNTGFGTTKIVTGDKTNAAPAVGTALSRSEYVKLMQEAERKGGREYDAVVNNLRSRRELGRKQGL